MDKFVTRAPPPSESRAEGRAPACPSISKDALIQLLREKFGYSAFRPLQEEVIRSILAGRDCVGLFPTGHGKSMLYMLPASILKGITVVVSPLIALVHDQIEKLQQFGVPAAAMNSSQTASEKQEVRSDLMSPNPTVKVVYLTPEFIAADDSLGLLRSLYKREKLSLFAIDECHCISSWGHDFRPAYLRLGRLHQVFPDVPILAVTATATAKVKQDVLKSLQLKRPAVYSASFDRPNIKYVVKYKELVGDTCSDIIHFIRRLPENDRCGIIYCHKRDTCDALAASISADGISCDSYHARKKDRERQLIQENWAKGELKVVIATVAFGMGIDKADVRFVIHFDMSKSVEAFYQESGRAGRDGKPSQSIVYYSRADRRTMEYLIKNGDSQKKENKRDSSDKKMAAFQRLVNVFEIPACRRRAILEYFGEDVKDTLGGEKRIRCCDFCDRPERIKSECRELFSGTDGPERSFRSSAPRNIGSWGAGGGFVSSETPSAVESDSFENFEGDDPYARQGGVSHMRGPRMTLEEIMAKRRRRAALTVKGRHSSHTSRTPDSSFTPTMTSIHSTAEGLDPVAALPVFNNPSQVLTCDDLTEEPEAVKRRKKGPDDVVMPPPPKRSFAQLMQLVSGPKKDDDSEEESSESASTATARRDLDHPQSSAAIGGGAQPSSSHAVSFQSAAQALRESKSQSRNESRVDGRPVPPSVDPSEDRIELPNLCDLDDDNRSRAHRKRRRHELPSSYRRSQHSSDRDRRRHTETSRDRHHR